MAHDKTIAWLLAAIEIVDRVATPHHRRKRAS
jgi:hypothetical protein